MAEGWYEYYFVLTRFTCVDDGVLYAISTEEVMEKISKRGDILRMIRNRNYAGTALEFTKELCASEDITIRRLCKDDFWF